MNDGPGPTGFDHPGCDRLRDEISRAQVDRNHIVKILCPRFKHRTVTRDAGVVDENVEWADVPEFTLYSLDIGDIKWQRVDRSKRRSNFPGSRFEFIVASRNERHLGAGLGECDCAGEADAARGTGDNRPSSVEAKRRRPRKCAHSADWP